VTLPVSLEVGPKRTFASAIDWPGWCRGAKERDAALEALAAYGPRYAKVARRARLSFPSSVDVEDLEVVERLRGGSGTDFGVPGTSGPSDDASLGEAEAERLVALLEAAWATFDSAAAAAVDVELRKGPRGGGRDLPKMTGHVLEAEAAYVQQLGGRPRLDEDADPGREMGRIRRRALEVFAARIAAEAIDDAANVMKPWTPRYYVRRAAWHVLDHAWEIEDRAG
jgi:hypothetical protein